MRIRVVLIHGLVVEAERITVDGNVHLGELVMPWTSRDATRHTKKARTPAAKRQWAHVANAVREKTGSDATAIREANAVVAARRKPKRG